MEKIIKALKEIIKYLKTTSSKIGNTGLISSKIQEAAKLMVIYNSKASQKLREIADAINKENMEENIEKLKQQAIKIIEEFIQKFNSK